MNRAICDFCKNKGTKECENCDDNESNFQNRE